MPQEIRVLRCVKCKTYQADIVKKANKWQCRMCQEKQSVFKELFRGTGAECRLKVQELNLNTNTEKIEVENEFLSLLEQDDFDIDVESIVKEHNTKDDSKTRLKIEDSKWNKYVEDPLKEHNMKSIDMEPSKSLKRKSNSMSGPSKLHCEQNVETATSTSSKWNKYL